MENPAHVLIIFTWELVMFVSVKPAANFPHFATSVSLVTSPASAQHRLRLVKMLAPMSLCSRIFNHPFFQPEIKQFSFEVSKSMVV